MNAAEYIKKIKLQRLFNSILFFSALVIIVLIFGTMDELNLPLLVVLVIVISILSFILMYRTEMISQQILFRDCNPQLYFEVMTKVRRKSSVYKVANEMYDISANFYLGNYQLVIELLQHNPVLFTKLQHEMMTYYIQSQFFLGDLIGLQNCRRIIEESRNNPHKIKRIKDLSDSVIALGDFADAYLKGDYAKAKDSCLNRKLIVKNVYAVELYNKYFIALSEKALGNNESANELFNFIIKNAGTLPIVNMSLENIVISPVLDTKSDII